MVTLTCTVCGREYEAVYTNRQYCSSRCKTRACRARKRAQAEAAAPARAELVAKLETFAPQTGALARELINTAGADCTELIVRLVAQAVREVGHARALTAASRAKGAPV